MKVHNIVQEVVTKINSKKKKCKKEKWSSEEASQIPEEQWTEVNDIVQETGIKTISKKMNAKRKNGCLRRPYK